MNFLAHVFLSGDDPKLMLGNFIADSVKGRQIDLYAPEIVKGIRLHRLIDSYTDTHEVVQETKARLRTNYRKYAPVIADMYYDHFLASRFSDYSQESLLAYTNKVYHIINGHFEILPDRVQSFFPHMMQHNWLLGYSKIEGITQALSGMSRRSTFLSGMETAGEELTLHYDLYAREFKLFFPELMRYVAEVKEKL